MKFCISVINEIEVKNEARKIKEVLINKGYIYDDIEPEIVISFGGDGTFLRSIQKYLLLNPLFVNINFGNLGYLCEYNAKEIDFLVEDLLKEKHVEKEVSLLETTYNNEKLYAINEFRIEADRGGTLIFDVKINGTFLEKYKGDGCLVSTSIGSSAMARSMGGALVDNEIEMIQFIEKVPIHNKFYTSINSPFVLNKDKSITIDSIEPQNFNLFYDCKGFNIKGFKGPLVFKISDKKIRFLKNERNNYIKKTREAFLND